MSFSLAAASELRSGGGGCGSKRHEEGVEVVARNRNKLPVLTLLLDP
jgi:hypothetical protein